MEEAGNKNKSRCIIIAGAPTIQWIPLLVTDYIIACDYGISHALSAGIHPDLLVGDFDSYPEPLPVGIPVLRAPAEKDDTDFMMAVRFALEEGFREFHLLAVLGGRFDHSFGNLSVAAYLAERTGVCYLYGEGENAVMVHNQKITMKGSIGGLLSVFSWSGHSYGIDYRGLKYPLRNATLSNTFPLGISNEFIKEEAEISVRDGTILIITERKQ